MHFEKKLIFPSKIFFFTKMNWNFKMRFCNFNLIIFESELEQTAFLQLPTYSLSHFNDSVTKIQNFDSQVGMVL